MTGRPNDRSAVPARRAFTHGVASGDVTATSVVLWTRVEEVGERPTPVSWSLWADDGQRVALGRTRADADADRTCRVMIDGLEPATRYHYVFEANGDRAVGRTRTLPLRSDQFRFAVTCCSRWGWPGFDRSSAILAESPDLVVHLGDYIYEVGEAPPAGPPTDPPHDCETLDHYRRRYRQHRSTPSLQRLHAAVPFLAVWDDHEVADNAPEPGAGERRSAGQRAWREWMPTRATATAPDLDRRIHIDGVLELLLVDSRFARRPAADTDGPSTDRPDTALLGPQQWAAVEAAAGVDVPWLVVANQVHVSPLVLGWLPAWRWPPWRAVINPDQWDGFPTERHRLIEILARAAGRPVLLSGDLHAGFSRRLLRDGREVAHEFTCPSISGTSFSEAVRERTRMPGWFVGRLVDQFNPGIDHLDLHRHGFLVVDVTPAALTTTFVHHDGTRVVRTLGEDDGSTDTLGPSPQATRRDVAQPG